MSSQAFSKEWFYTSDGKRLMLRKMQSIGEKKKNVLILHGMAEYGKRYERFASFLSQKGMNVFVPDIRGFGESLVENQKGFFAYKNGWQRIIEDAVEIAKKIISFQSSVPLVLFAHSMGSYLARCVMTHYPEAFSAVVLSGAGDCNSITRSFGKLVASFEKKRIGATTQSCFLDKLSFGNFNKPFCKTGEKSSGFEWLTRDENELKKYLGDENCGFVCTSSFYYDLICGVIEACSSENAESTDKNIPILFISGSDDPVGNFTKGVLKSAVRYKNAGVRRVDVRLIEGARHEILNELERDKSMMFIYDWIENYTLKERKETIL